MDENKKSKIEEPFSPENTPNPPQIIDPNKRDEQPGDIENKSKPNAESDRKKNRQSPEPEQGGKKEKQLGDETEITDETTI